MPVKAITGYTFGTRLAHITIYLVPFAHDGVRTVTFGATIGRLEAVKICIALLVTLKESSTNAFVTTPAGTLEVIVTKVILCFLAVKASGRVDTVINTAAEGSLNAIVVALAKDLCRGNSL